MRRVIWSDQAIEDLQAIGKYVAEFNPFAADRLTDRLIDVAESLRSFPERGKAISRTRRELLTVKPYSIRYLVIETEVAILNVRHTARRPLR